MVLLDTGCQELVTDTSLGGHVAHDPHGAGARECGLPLEAVGRRVLPSTHGPVDHVLVQCPRGHRYTHVATMDARRHDDDPGDQAEAA